MKLNDNRLRWIEELREFGSSYDWNWNGRPELLEHFIIDFIEDCHCNYLFGCKFCYEDR